MNPVLTAVINNAAKDRGGWEPFDRLFREHTERLRVYSVTIDEIGQTNPELTTKVHDAVKKSDDAWYRQDQQTFKTALEYVETLYLSFRRE